MNQNQMLNKKRNHEEAVQKEDEWQGNIFEEDPLMKQSGNPPPFFKKYYQEPRDAREVYRKDYPERRDNDYKDYEQKRYRNPSDNYGPDNRRPRNYYNNNNNQRRDYEYNNSNNNYHNDFKRNDYYHNRKNDYQHHRRPYHRNRSDSREKYHSGGEKSDKRSGIMTKNFNFLIALPKNYRKIVQDNFDNISKEVNEKISRNDLKAFEISYFLDGYEEEVILIDGTIDAKAEVLKICCDYIYRSLKERYQNLTYVKIPILVPQHLVGYVIGIDGKNVNKIRDLTEAKIEIPPGASDSIYKKIDISGKSMQIKRATERIYRIVNEYYFSKFNSKNRESEKDSKNVSRSRSKDSRKHRSREKEERKAESDKNKSKSENKSLQDKNSYYSSRSRSYSRRSFSPPQEGPIIYDDKDIKNAQNNLKEYIQNSGNAATLAQKLTPKFNLLTTNISFSIEKCKIQISYKR